MKAFVLVLVILAIPGLASAQGAVGSGPLTSSLADTEPTTGVFSWGSVKFAPGISVREIGHDDNVFDEATDPKEDWVAAGTPDVSVFARLRFVQISAYAGAEMQYYNVYTSERSITPQYRGRIDFLLSRVFPFVGGGESKTRTRPNGEIDVRADQLQTELSGGIGYTLSGHSAMFFSTITSKTRFTDSQQGDVPLDQSLDRNGTEYQAGVKTDLTPLLSLEVKGGYRKDKFVNDPTRNGETVDASAVFQFSPVAVVTGNFSLGYQDYRPVDPLVTPYQGVTGSGSLSYSFLELARINLGYNRSMEYSFDVTEAYYLQNAINLALTMRIVGDLDWQARGSFSRFDYGNRVGAVARHDTLQEYGGSLGYNLRNRTRIAANYEYAERQSPEVAERNYVRRRVYLNWALAF